MNKMVSSFILRSQVSSGFVYFLAPAIYFVNFGESRVQIMKDMLMTLYATSR